MSRLTSLIKSFRVDSVLMVCTAARGGMRAVVEGYRSDGIFDKWNVHLISPHDEGTMLKRIALAVSAYAEFLSWIILGRVKLVHCHAAMRGSFWRKSVFSLTARFFGIPVLFHLHGSEMKTFVSGLSGFSRKILTWILEKQSAVVVLSPSWQSFVKSIAPKATVTILPNYVPNPPGQAKRIFSSAPAEILFLGYVGDRKGVFELLPAIACLARAGHNLHLTIGGNGEVERARDLAQTLGIGSLVTFAGWVSGAEKERLLQNADIFILPSHNEGLPVSLLEAMRLGIPVISTRVGGIPELIDEGVSGLLVTAGNVEEIASAISRFVEDQTFARLVGEEGMRRVKDEFSSSIGTQALNEIYERVSRNGALTC